MELLDESSYLTVKVLCEQLRSSEATIRRDLLKLSKRQLLRRVHGGAEAIELSASELNQTEFADNTNTALKQKLACAAVELCENNESIIISGGGICAMMATYLRERNLNILTNYYPLATELAATSKNRITLPGGELYPQQKIILSAYENDTIQNYRASKMFLDATGLNQQGVTELDPLLIRTEMKLLNQSEQLIVLTEGSKIGAGGNLILCSLSRVGVVITDDSISDDSRKFLSRAGVKIIVVAD